MGDLRVETASVGEILRFKSETNQANEKTENLERDKNKQIFQKLHIPYYQRPYTWTTQNVNELIDDILEAINSGKENYLVGNIILHDNDENDETLDIIDGQQRLTTLALIIHSYLQNNDKLPEWIKISDSKTLNLLGKKSRYKLNQITSRKLQAYTKLQKNR